MGHGAGSAFGGAGRSLRLAAAAAFAVAAGAGAAGGAAGQPVPPILIELPDKSVVPLDQAPGVRGRLTMPISRWVATPDWMQRSITMYAAAAPFCPPSRTWVLGGGAKEHEAARRQCDRSMQARLGEYPQADRQRCACAVVMTGRPSERLRVSSPAFTDPLFYETATVVVTRPGGVERMRGFRASNAREWHLYNADRKLVCSSAGAPRGQERTYSCFGGLMTAKGNQREYREEDGDRWLFYTVGRFELSNGERVDFVTNLNDAELRARHPKFPD